MAKALRVNEVFEIDRRVSRRIVRNLLLNSAASTGFGAPLGLLGINAASSCHALPTEAGSRPPPDPPTGSAASATEPSLE